MFLKRAGVPLLVVLGLFLCVATGAWVYNLTIVQDTIGWRISQLRADIKYAVSPPEEAVFTPDPTIAAIVESTLMAITPSSTRALKLMIFSQNVFPNNNTGMGLIFLV